MKWTPETHEANLTLAQVIPLAIQVSIGLIVFGIALRARFGDLAYLLERPGLLARSLLAVFVVMPVLAVVLAVGFDLNPVVEVALIALALAPVPPILPKKELTAGGEPSYAIGLLVIAALVAIVFVPPAVALLGRIFGRPVHQDAGVVAKIVALSIIVPLLAGLMVGRLAPSFAGKAARPLSIIATVLLVVAALPILISEWPSVMALVGNFSIVAIALFSLVGLGVGHALGGPHPDDRTVLALSTTMRHPGIALAITAEMPDKKALLAAVLLVVIVGTVVSGAYVKWRQHVREAGRAPHRPKRAL
jgi:BASS family bile acid:Na+ symporter